MATKEDKATLAEELNPHAAAFAERAKAPALYEDPTIATPGKLRNVEDFAGPVSLVAVDTEETKDPANGSDLDTSVDNRDQVQEVLDLNQEDLERRVEHQVEVAQANAEAQSEGLDAETVARGVGPQVRQQGAVKKPSSARSKTS